MTMYTEKIIVIGLSAAIILGCILISGYVDRKKFKREGDINYDFFLMQRRLMRSHPQVFQDEIFEFYKRWKKVDMKLAKKYTAELFVLLANKQAISKW